jgi:tetratricopeptide (TPR) repeat protein
MKKLLIIAIMAGLITGLFADPHDQSEYEEYQKYQKSPSAETFLDACKYYSARDDETAKLLLAYLHYSELDNHLEYFSANLDSLSMKTQFNYANLLLDLGRYEESIAVYQILTEKSPQWGCPWRHKGEAFWKMGELDKAQQSLQESINVRENHYDAYVMLAEVQFEAGKAEQALKTLEKGFEYRAENTEYSEDDEFEKNVKELHEKLKAALK